MVRGDLNAQRIFRNPTVRVKARVRVKTRVLCKSTPIVGVRVKARVRDRVRVFSKSIMSLRGE